MRAPSLVRSLFARFVVSGLVTLGACVDDSGPGARRGAAGEIAIVAAPDAAVPYQFGPNTYGIAGGAFLAKANMGSSTVVLDPTQGGKICLKGTVEKVPTPADGSHPLYSEYWGIELGFNLNQGADGLKNPWLLPAGVTGFWFAVQGAAIPPMRLKTTPTGKDPALEQDSCALVSPPTNEPVEVPFTSMYVQCWNGPQGTGPTEIANGLVDMGLQVAAATGVEYPIDFCLTHIGVVTQ